MKSFKISMLLSIPLSLIVLSGCYYDEIPDIGSIDRDVSFAADIIPIMNASCNSSGCHNTGGVPPDLSPQRAYDELSTPDLVDLVNPTESKLYKHMIGTESLMPPAGQLPGFEVSLILGWIEQGVPDN